MTKGLNAKEALAVLEGRHPNHTIDDLTHYMEACSRLSSDLTAAQARIGELEGVLDKADRLAETCQVYGSGELAYSRSAKEKYRAARAAISADTPSAPEPFMAGDEPVGEG